MNWFIGTLIVVVPLVILLSAALIGMDQDMRDMEKLYGLRRPRH